MPEVYRAPMRSRRDDVDHAGAVRRALRLGLVGVGGRLEQAPRDLAEAVAAVRAAYDDRMARRLERFVAVADGSFVWTRDADGSCFLGRVTGSWRYDADPAAYDLDLVHVRHCSWLADPVPIQEVPPAVLETFARGGRNFQRIRHPDVGDRTAALWARRA